jgi:uncharacterized protein GlcG (DUF336 family)
MEAVGEAVSVCAGQGHRVTATVIDPQGVRLAILHGDGSGLHTIDASYSKAFAAVSFAAAGNRDQAGKGGRRVSAVADSHKHIHRDTGSGDQAGDRMRSAGSGYGEASERQQERVAGE